MNNKNVMFIASGGKQWIGGLYYVKNVIYTLLKKGAIDSSTKVYILVEEENLDMFKSLIKHKNIEILMYNNNSFNNIVKRITGKIFNNVLDLELLFKSKKLKIDYLYPINFYPFIFLKSKCVFWIPDFQHIHLPQMFSKEEIERRNKLFKYMAQNHKNLVLSSKDAYNDYKYLYPNYIHGVHVLNFESDIEDELKSIDNEFITNIIKKYNLSEKFIFMPNQFWKHKNHITAFKAVEYIVNKKNTEICLVCTGNTEDYRNKEHFSRLIKFIKDNKLEKNIKILGFIPRKDQLALMKQSVVVLQPSLFEGWGTVVEDAKALNKEILMSNINVHFEQKNDKCVIFEKESFHQLAEIIMEILSNGYLNLFNNNKLKDVENQVLDYSKNSQNSLGN